MVLLHRERQLENVNQKDNTLFCVVSLLLAHVPIVNKKPSCRYKIADRTACQ